MSRRSPQNPRYQKDKVGKTRKSAASAKPKRGSGDRRSSASSGKKKTKQPWWKRIEPVTNDEIKRYRRRWWVFLGLALLAAMGLLVPAVQESVILRSMMLGVWLASFVTALYIDLVKIRKLRKEEIARMRKEGGS